MATLPLARELKGNLPCVRCKYDLKGLTVKGMCPECGTSVRTTLLAVVDPQAKELRPIHSPRWTGIGLVVWATSALLATLCVWFLRAEDFMSRPASGSPEEILAWSMLWLTGASGVGALALVCPHAGIPSRQRLAALLGVLLYVPLVVVLYYTHLRWDASNRAPYGLQVEVLPGRLALRLLASVFMAAILLLLRPNARLLSARWVLMRIGVADRQTMLALAVVVGVWTLGDAIRFASLHFHGGFDDTVRSVGTAIVLVGSLLFTAGLASAMLDAWKLRGIIAQPPLNLDDLVEREATAPGGTPSTIAPGSIPG